MPNLFQLDIPLFGMILVLLLMGFLSLVLFLSLYLKSRAVRKLPKNLSITVFNKTFNIFNPYTAQRRIIEGSATGLLLLIISIVATFLLFFVVAKIIEMDFLPSFIIFIICAALMTLDECFETYKNAGIFVRAIESGNGLGEGDLTVLSIVKKTLPKLEMYYLSLAIIFFASSVTLPYTMPIALLIFTRFVTALFELTAFGGILAYLYLIFLIAVVTTVIQIMVGKVRSKIFGFPPSESLVSLGKQFELMKLWVRWHMHELAHRTSPEPEENPYSEREKA